MNSRFLKGLLCSPHRRWHQNQNKPKKNTTRTHKSRTKYTLAFVCQAAARFFAKKWSIFSPSDFSSLHRSTYLLAHDCRIFALVSHILGRPGSRWKKENTRLVTRALFSRDDDDDDDVTRRNNPSCRRQKSILPAVSLLSYSHKHFSIPSYQ